MNDPAQTAWTAITLWVLVGVLWTAIPLAIIVVAINGVRDEIRRLVDALKDLDNEEEPSEP